MFSIGPGHVVDEQFMELTFAEGSPHGISLHVLKYRCPDTFLCVMMYITLISFLTC